jgi:hypothetical protein
VKSPDVLSRPLKNVSIACAVSFKVNQSQNRLLRDVKLCSSHFPPIENKSQYQSCGKILAASFSTLKLVNHCVIYGPSRLGPRDIALGKTIMEERVITSFLPGEDSDLQAIPPPWPCCRLFTPSSSIPILLPHFLLLSSIPINAS